MGLLISISFTEDEPNFNVKSRNVKNVKNDGWLRDEEGNLIFWVPDAMRHGVQDMSEMTLPLDAPKHSVFLDCTKMKLGEQWEQVKVIVYNQGISPQLIKYFEGSL